MLAALGGYVLGTLQVILLDWFKNRSAHRRQLKLIRSDLSNAATYESKFNWPDVVDAIPIPPDVSPNFQTTLPEIDFELTDEHNDDNSQAGLLNITSNFDVLKYYQTRFSETHDAMRGEQNPTSKQALRETGITYMNGYDARHDQTMFLINDAINDINRRLKEIRFWPQFTRLFKRMPKGSNPAPLLQDGDPRVEEFLRRRKAASVKLIDRPDASGQ